MVLDLHGMHFHPLKVEAGKVVVPTGALYTPLKQREDLPIAAYDPIYCSESIM